MKKIYIFGLGKGKPFVDRCLKDDVEMLAFIDNYKAASLRQLNGVPIITQEELPHDFDYIIVTLMKYESTRKQLVCQGVDADKIICFFDYECAEREDFWSVLDSYKWRIELMWKHYRSVTMPTLDNLIYEIYGDSESVQQQCPKIVDVDKTAEILLKDRKSLARFGDGEFELMCGRRRALFQDIDDKISERLREALNSENDNLLVAIADNYGKLDKYTDDAAEAIRSYMSSKVRKEHMELLSPERQYYDAYISRPYIMYRDKLSAGKRFENVKKIWERQEVLVVEGEFTRFGVGNDLLDNASQVFRILVPSKNAFSVYDEIIDTVRQYGKNKLILAILGPTASVLAYDLANDGYWIIDIGQLDVEYEWYLRNADTRCDIPYKCVSEVLQYNEILTDEQEEYIKKYKSEIIVRIL